MSEQRERKRAGEGKREGNNFTANFSPAVFCLCQLWKAKIVTENWVIFAHQKREC